MLLPAMVDLLFYLAIFLHVKFGVLVSTTRWQHSTIFLSMSILYLIGVNHLIVFETNRKPFSCPFHFRALAAPASLAAPAFSLLREAPRLRFFTSSCRGLFSLFASYLVARGNAEAVTSTKKEWRDGGSNCRSHPRSNTH